MLARSLRLPATCRAALVGPSRRAPFLTIRARPSVRPRAYSALMFLGVEKDGEAKDDGSAAQGGAAPARQAEGAVAELRSDVDALKERMEQIAAQLEQLNDRARNRAVSLAEAVRAAEGGEAGPMEQLQRQQDDQLEHDEKSWDTMMDSFTQLMSRGYIASAEKIRDRLLISEWELSRKQVAQRRGVTQFELHCASNKVPLPYELLTQLYEEPDRLEIIQDPHQRMQARASIQAATDEEYLKCWDHCTAEAQKLAEHFSKSEIVSKTLPDNFMEGLKKVVPAALKLTV